MLVWVYSLLSVLIVSLISLVGVLTLSLKPERLRKVLLFLVSFAVGSLFGDAIIHLIPESFRRFDSPLTASLFIILGILLFFTLEKFLRWRHCHVLTSREHRHPVVALNLIGDAVHNLMDGMIIGASFSASIPIGCATTLAVVLHEIPQEIGDFGILIHGGLSIRKALAFNFLSALTAVAGVVISLTLGRYVDSYALYLLPITAGGFLYIAGSDLIPELQHGTDVKLSASIWQFICISLGVALMALLVFLE